MSVFLALLKREMQAIFLSPVAYACGILALLGSGFCFMILLASQLRMGPSFALKNMVHLFFAGFILIWFAQIFLVSALTMRLFSEEKRSGTIEPLLTAPVTDVQVVLAKYAGALLYWLLLWLPTLGYFLVLGSKAFEWKLLGSAYLGVALVGAMTVAVGCLASALCTSQMVAALFSSTGLTALLFGPPMLLSFTTVRWEWLRKTLEYLNVLPLGPHTLLGDFCEGLGSLGHLFYPISVTAACLFVTVKVLSSRSWK